MDKFVSFALAVVVWPVLAGATAIVLVVLSCVLLLPLAAISIAFGIPIPDAIDKDITSALIKIMCLIYVIASAYVFVLAYRFFRSPRSTDTSLRE